MVPAKFTKAQKLQRYVRITRIGGITFFTLGVLLNVLRRTPLFDGPQAQIIMEYFHHFYEGLFRALLYAVGTYCTLAYAKLKGRPASKFRKYSLISLTVTTFLFIGLLPLLSGVWEYYLMFMPFPITTPSFQLRFLGHHYDHTFMEVYGPAGLRTALSLYFGYHMVAYIGTLLWGRRVHCSMLCVFNGNTAETLGLGLPVIPHDKKRPQSKRIHPIAHGVLRGIQVLYIVVSGSVVVLWLLHGLFDFTPLPVDTLITIERMMYRVFGLLLLSLFTLFLSGRALCIYCPAGTLYGWVGRLAGQEITTNLTECISCGLCNQACKMSLDIMSAAQQKIPLRATNCVGCGLCVDACPTSNLAYNTTFTHWLKRRKS